MAFATDAAELLTFPLARARCHGKLYVVLRNCHLQGIRQLLQVENTHVPGFVGKGDHRFYPLSHKLQGFSYTPVGLGNLQQS